MAKLDPISGFPEFLPAQQIAHDRMVETIRQTFESFGFLPVETPVVERLSTLQAKGVGDKEIYGLRRIQGDDEGGKDLALRFDLTVPLARYVAQHANELVFPFRRHQIQPVWRGERPQAGRFRQFTQCDIDVIGDGVLGLDHDAEIPAVIYSIFRTLAIGKFTIRINNRKILGGLFQSLGLTDDTQVRQAVGVVDELERVGADVVRTKLEALGLASEKATDLIDFFAIDGDGETVLRHLDGMDLNETFETGVEELVTVYRGAPYHVSTRYGDGPLIGVDDARARFFEHFKIDLGIARGLDYYTGTVFETRLDARPTVGSICSGGRYENLVSQFGKRALPGVGISIGLTRLVSQLLDLDLMPHDVAAVAPVLVTVQDRSIMHRYFDLAARLRYEGIRTETYLENKALKAQLKYAERKGIPVVVIANAEELATDTCHVRSMQHKQQTQCRLGLLGRTVKAIVPPTFTIGMM